MAAKILKTPWNVPTRPPKPTITCGHCKEEHNTFEDIQECRATIDARRMRAFEAAAVAAWELLEQIKEYKPS